MLRTLALLRDEAAVLDAAVDAALAEAGDRRARRRSRGLPPALARLAVQRLADRAAGGRAPAIGHRTARDPRARRGRRRSTSAAACAPRSAAAALRFGAQRRPGGAAPRRARP